MTMSSWFGSESTSHHQKNAVSVKDAVQYMHPKRGVLLANVAVSSSSRSRFSQLLLEHGEKPLQDWAVVAHSSPASSASSSSSKSAREQQTLSKKQQQRSQDGTGGGVQWAQSPHKKPQKHNKTKRPSIVDKELYPSAHMSRLEGRLHLCTGSLVFEPNDFSRGIVRCPFKRMDDCPVEHPSESGFESMCIFFVAKKHYVMKANNTIGPYQTVSNSCHFRFTFLHSSPTSLVEICQELYPLPINSPELEKIVQNLLLDRPFNYGNLVDVREQVLSKNLRCSILTPLQSKLGTLVITNQRMYFQLNTAATNAGTEDSRAETWNLSDVVACARRYKGLRDSALEVYWKDETSTLFAFDRRHDRELVFRLLPSLVPCFTDREFVVQVTQEWGEGTISNYEYLLALNSAAGRSFHDLSRYPVFPWVLADYESTKLDLNKPETFRDLSKPVGALKAERLEYFKTRYKGMEEMEEPFLYGTHYSAPGYVLYFLVRCMPEQMLCLQNGKFDAPDRMFHSVAKCYTSALTNHADVKELIPEFYNAGHDFDFLINAKGLQLGAMQTGDRVNDVKLPPWARSARDFIKKNRKALESELCTKSIPKWIDLIFGSKSRGEGALEADNVFHHYAYLGPTDLAGMQTEEERFQAELHSTEFGIVPDQLFCVDHPLKQAITNDDFVSKDIGRASSKDESGREAWELLDAPMETSVVAGRLGNSLESPEIDIIANPKTSDSSAFSFPNKPWGQHNVRSDSPEHPLTPSPSNLPLSGSGEGIEPGEGFSDEPHPERPEASSPRSPQEESPAKMQQALDGSSSDWDMNILERKQIHSDAVSGCVLFLENRELPLMVTTSLDGGLMVHTVSMDASPSEEQTNLTTGFTSTLTRFSYSSIMSRAGQAPVQSKLTEYRTHSSRDPLASLVLASDGAGGSVAFVGGHDDIVLAYGIKSACGVASVYSHRDAVTGLDLATRTPFDADSVIWPEHATHILVSGSWDATVKVWSASVSGGETVVINREPLAELFDADSSIVSVSSKLVPNGGIMLAAGCTDGSFCVWNLHNDGVQVLIHKEAARKVSGACSVVRWISEGGGRLHLITGFSTGRLVSYALLDGSLHRKSAVSIGVAITSLVHTDRVLLIGCADGGLRLVPIRDCAYFDSKPTLWTAVNNQKTSPGISSISLTITEPDTSSGQAADSRCLCCTGAEDGSVVLFELKKV